MKVLFTIKWKSLFVISFFTLLTAIMIAGCKPLAKENKKTPKTYAVTVTPPANGAISVKKGGAVLTGEALKSVEENTELEITLTADSGYKTAKLVIDSVEETQSSDGGKTISKKVKVTKALTVSGELLLVFKSFEVNGVSFKMYGIAAVDKAELGDDAKANNKPHTVNLSAYSMGETEVTQGLYKAVMNVNPSYLDGDGSSSPEKATPSGEEQEKRPVETIDWYDAVLFCNELTKKINGNSMEECVYYSDAAFQHVYTNENANKKNLPYMNTAKKGFRLPTEAEWEWAAKGGKNNIWAGTDDKDSLEEYAWYADPNAIFDPLAFVTHQTAVKKENGYKLYDMSGNVAEWCWDWYNKDYCKNLPPNAVNPVGADTGRYRVMRGGDFFTVPEECECSYRTSRDPKRKDHTVGFRLAFSM